MSTAFTNESASSRAAAPTPDGLVRDLKELPSAPMILPRLKRLLQDSDCALTDITALIRMDPGLAARVLQVANSVCYNPGLACDTVEEAVQRVGCDQVYAIVAYAVASQVLVRPVEVYGLEPGELWEISLGGALAAEAVAERTGQDRSAAYTVGLLHGVGMAAIAQWSARHDPSLFLPGKGFPDEWTGRERAVFKFTHADVGAALLRKWAFAENIVEAVRWQYAPGGAGAHRGMAALLYAARWLRHAVRGEEPPPPEPAELAAIGLSGDDLAQEVSGVAERLAALGEGLRTAGAPATEHRKLPEAATS